MRIHRNKKKPYKDLYYAVQNMVGDGINGAKKMATLKRILIFDSVLKTSVNSKNLQVTNKRG